MYAALETAFETALPAEAEAVPYPSSAVEEASAEFDVFLPRRRPAGPAAAPRDNAPGPQPGPADPPSPPRHQAPDLAVLDQVLRSLQRMA